MKIFDLLNMKAEDYVHRNANVFFQNDQFKTRIIELEKNGMIPPCDMDSFVLFLVLEGKVNLSKNDNSKEICEGQLFISEPAQFSMKSTDGAKILGIQIEVKK
ncbi:MAG: hypothetical protein ACLFPS_05630 [Clostridia bacterium]